MVRRKENSCPLNTLLPILLSMQRTYLYRFLFLESCLLFWKSFDFPKKLAPLTQPISLFVLCYLILVLPPRENFYLNFKSHGDALGRINGHFKQCRTNPKAHSHVPHLVSVSGICISESLDIIEDQPCQGDDHQHDEGDGDKHHWGTADVFLQVACSNCYIHHHSNIPLQQTHYLFSFRLRNHYCYYIFYTCQIGEGGGETIRKNRNSSSHKRRWVSHGTVKRAQQSQNKTFPSFCCMLFFIAR